MNSTSFVRGLKTLGILLMAAAGTAAIDADSAVQSLFDALRQGNMAQVKVALNSGADVNSRDQYGNSLLMQAALYGTAADLDFLLARGAQVNAANQTGHTAVMR